MTLALGSQILKGKEMVLGNYEFATASINLINIFLSEKARVFVPVKFFQVDPIFAGSVRKSYTWVSSCFTLRN